MGILYVPLQNTYILLWYIHSLNGSEFFDEIEFYPVFIAFAKYETLYLISKATDLIFTVL